MPRGKSIDQDYLHYNTAFNSESGDYVLHDLLETFNLFQPSVILSGPDADDPAVMQMKLNIAEGQRQVVQYICMKMKLTPEQIINTTIDEADL